MEACLLKVSTPIMLANPHVSYIIRQHDAHMVEVNPTYSIIEKKGMTEDILALYRELNALGSVLQFVRSGRIAVTRSTTERLDRYLEEREKTRK